MAIKEIIPDMPGQFNFRNSISLNPELRETNINKR